MDLLQEVNEELLSTVFEVLKQDWPKHFLPYQMFKVLNVFKEANCQFKHTIYLYGDIATGVYLVKVTLPTSGKLMHCLYMYTPSNNLTALDKVLQQSCRIPWFSEPFLFEMIPSNLRPLIEKAFAVRGIKCLAKPNIVFKFPVDVQLVDLEIPDDVYLDFLSEAHSEEVDRNWPHRYPGSDLLHRECITKNFGLGIFRKSDGKMLSSSICNYTGGIFVLYSDPEFRGRGFASMVVLQMVREIRNRGWEPFCTIYPGNTPSLKVFKKLGFKYFDMVDYYRII